MPDRGLQSLAIIVYTYLVTPHLINDFQIGYTQNFIHFQISGSSDPTLATSNSVPIEGDTHR